MRRISILISRDVWYNLTVMFFTYTYRTPSGARKQSEVEAASRAECFALLKARGIVPLAVREGRAPAGAGGTTVRGGSFGMKGLAAGLIVVGLSALAWFCLFRNDVENVPEKPARVKTEAAKPKKRTVSQPTTMPVQKAKRVASSGISVADVVAGERISTNKFVRADIPEPKPIEELTPPPRPAFSTSAEQLLAMATPPDPSQPVPPLPNLDGEDSKEELEKALNNVIAPTTNDTIDSLQMKMNVAEQKEEFRKLRAEEGWTFKEYLTALREKHNDDAQYISDAHRVNEENYNNPEMSDEEYLKQRKIINDGLRERGLPELE